MNQKQDNLLSESFSWGVWETHKASIHQAVATALGVRVAQMVECQTYGQKLQVNLQVKCPAGMAGEFSSRLSVLTLIRCPFPPYVTTVACKMPQSFFQKCRWQVSLKQADTFNPTKVDWAECRPGLVGTY